MTEEGTGTFPAVLDLSTADTSGNKMDNGWKDAVVSEVEPIETTNPEGNLPVGTPGVNVMFRIDGGPFDNRPVWNRYWFPPTDYDEEKRNRSLGMFATFLMAIGYPEDQVKTGQYKLDFEDMVGRPCKVNTRYDEEYQNNRVTGIKSRDASGGSNPGGLL